MKYPSLKSRPGYFLYLAELKGYIKDLVRKTLNIMSQLLNIDTGTYNGYLIDLARWSINRLSQLLNMDRL